MATVDDTQTKQLPGERCYGNAENSTATSAALKRRNFLPFRRVIVIMFTVIFKERLSLSSFTELSSGTVVSESGISLPSEVRGHPSFRELLMGHPDHLWVFYLQLSPTEQTPHRTKRRCSWDQPRLIGAEEGRLFQNKTGSEGE